MLLPHQGRMEGRKEGRSMLRESSLTHCIVDACEDHENVRQSE